MRFTKYEEGSGTLGREEIKRNGPDRLIVKLHSSDLAPRLPPDSASIVRVSQVL